MIQLLYDYHRDKYDYRGYNMIIEAIVRQMNHLTEGEWLEGIMNGDGFEHDGIYRDLEIWTYDCGQCDYCQKCEYCQKCADAMDEAVWITSANARDAIRDSMHKYQTSARMAMLIPVIESITELRPTAEPKKVDVPKKANVKLLVETKKVLVTSEKGITKPRTSRTSSRTAVSALRTVDTVIRRIERQHVQLPGYSITQVDINRMALMMTNIRRMSAAQYAIQHQ